MTNIELSMTSEEILKYLRGGEKLRHSSNRKSANYCCKSD